MDRFNLIKDVDSLEITPMIACLKQSSIIEKKKYVMTEDIYENLNKYGLIPFISDSDNHETLFGQKIHSISEINEIIYNLLFIIYS